MGTAYVYYFPYPGESISWRICPGMLITGLNMARQNTPKTLSTRIDATDFDTKTLNTLPLNISMSVHQKIARWLSSVFNT